MLQNSTKEFYAFNKRTIFIQWIISIFNERIILIQRIIDIFNEIIILIQRIIYIFNKIIILIQRIIYITYSRKELFSFKKLFIQLTKEVFSFSELFIYSTNYLCIQRWTNIFYMFNNSEIFFSVFKILRQQTFYRNSQLGFWDLLGNYFTGIYCSEDLKFCWEWFLLYDA